VSVEKPGLTPDYCFSKKQEFSEKNIRINSKKEWGPARFFVDGRSTALFEKNTHIFQSMILNISNHTEYGNSPSRWIAEL